MSQHIAVHAVAKRTQHVALNNVAVCCVCMLRSFDRGLKLLCILENQDTWSVIHDASIQTIPSSSWVYSACPFTLVPTQELARQVVPFLLYHVIVKLFYTPSSIAVEAGIAGFHVNSCAICGYFYLFVSYFSRFHSQRGDTTCEITYTNPVSFVFHNITFLDEIRNETDAVSYSLTFLKNSRQGRLPLHGIFLKLINNSSSLNKGNHDHDDVWIERFSIECRKTKTRVFTIANHKGHRYSSEPIKTRSNYM